MNTQPNNAKYLNAARQLLNEHYAAIPNRPLIILSSDYESTVYNVLGMDMNLLAECLEAADKAGILEQTKTDILEQLKFW